MGRGEGLQEVGVREKVGVGAVRVISRTVMQRVRSLIRIWGKNFRLPAAFISSNSNCSSRSSKSRNGSSISNSRTIQLINRLYKMMKEEIHNNLPASQWLQSSSGILVYPN